MVALKRTQIRTLDALFQMEGGYVLDFSDRTMSEWFEDELAIKIYSEKYSGHGASKAKHIRCFIEVEDAHTVIKMLGALWDYRNTLQIHMQKSAEAKHQDTQQFLSILNYIEAHQSTAKTDAIERFHDDATLDELVAALERDIKANKPAVALDRLHTYCMKLFAHLLETRGEACRKEDPLHSRAGRYVKLLEAKGGLRPITLRIMKSMIGVFDSYNAVRNDASFAHDNNLVDADEARFIYDTITSILRFLKTLETPDNVSSYL